MASEYALNAGCRIVRWARLYSERMCGMEDVAIAELERYKRVVDSLPNEWHKRIGLALECDRRGCHPDYWDMPESVQIVHAMDDKTRVGFADDG